MRTSSGDNIMDTSSFQAIIGPDLFVEGEVRSSKAVLVLGLIDGLIAASHVVVRKGGRVHGTLIADSAEIEGEVQGNILVRTLMRIGSTGSVRGDIRYGSIAIAEGAELSADLRNVPPAIAGDLNLAVKRGKSVRITTDDLTAIDPDSTVDSLKFAVPKALNGFVAFDGSEKKPVVRFTQADLLANRMVFVHDGSIGASASFDVTVTDQAGATSGPPQTVRVAVF
jgi:cytoskeletal protein CcmA (bactofilin family)